MAQVDHLLDRMYDGVGILSLISEATIRMGGVRITSCDSGVYRSLMSLTLEEAALLVRCHGLPMKGFRTVLNTLREVSLHLQIQAYHPPPHTHTPHTHTPHTHTHTHAHIHTNPLCISQNTLSILEKKNNVNVKVSFPSVPPKYVCVCVYDSHFTVN